MAETIQVTEPSIIIPSVGKKIVIISDNLSFTEQLITEYESLYLESNLTFYIFDGKNYDWLLLNLAHVDTIIFDLEFKDKDVYWIAPYLLDKFVILIGNNETITKILSFGSISQIFDSIEHYIDTLQKAEDFAT
jgi:hypothetical protein|tara:strand:+ start:448 stop:849 length:402 start_codon:yes stop_codon:yes gene_type:complete